MSSPNNPPDRPPQPNPILDSYQSFLSRTPPVTSLVLHALCGSYLLSFLLPSLPLVLGNVPYFTLQNLELYRLVLSPFVVDSLLNVLFVCLTFTSRATFLEATLLGSSRFLLLLSSFCVSINVVFVTAIYLLSYLLSSPPLLLSISFGFWPCLIALLSYEASLPHNANISRPFLCFPVSVPAPYHPLLLVAFMSLLGGGPKPDLLSALLVGYGPNKVPFIKASGVFSWERGSIANWEQNPSSPLHYLATRNRAAAIMQWVPDLLQTDGSLPFTSAAGAPSSASSSSSSSSPSAQSMVGRSSTASRGGIFGLSSSSSTPSSSTSFPAPGVVAQPVFPAGAGTTLGGGDAAARSGGGLEREKLEEAKRAMREAAERRAGGS